jgi:divalent metal cation (Fe/Co/Zn/Cd) transporter
VSRSELSKRRKADETLWQLVRSSKDPSVFTVFIEDTAALAGLAIAAGGVFLGHALRNPYFDPAASIVVGCILIAASVVLARETGGLLVGESMDRGQLDRLRDVIAGDPAVEKVGQLLTMQLGPEDVLLTADVRFVRTLSIDEVDCTIDRLEHRVKQQDPAIQRIFFRPAQRTQEYASQVTSASDE